MNHGELEEVLSTVGKRLRALRQQRHATLDEISARSDVPRPHPRLGIWAAGGDAELHVFPGGFHDFDFLVPGAALSRDARLRWLHRTLAVRRADGKSPVSGPPAGRPPRNTSRSGSP